MLEPPEFLTESQRASWDRVVASAPREMAGIDESLLLSWVVAEDQYRSAVAMQAQIDSGAELPMLTKDRHGNPVTSPYLAIMSRASAQMAKAAQALGFKPGDRSRAPAADGDMLVSKRELCNILRISRPTLDNWLDRNDDFPVVDRGTNGREWQFDPAVVIAYLRAKKDEEQREAAERAAQLDQFALPIEDTADADTRALTPQQRFHHARARQVEHDLALQTGKAAWTADVRTVLQPAISRLADAVESMHVRVSREHQFSPAGLRALQDQFRDIRASFDRELPGYLTGDQGSAPAQSAEPALL